ncbi:MAG: hypothetical protein ITG02_07690 [Patulibacter sp.]|nr:hypothetical protein [Patulibacter sp.]
MSRSVSTPIEVWKGHGTRYHSSLHRRDGVTVRLEGGSYNKLGGPVRRIPHDIVHRTVEHHFGVDAGLWGVLAGGGTVQNASFVEGRLPPNALRRATAMTDRVGESLRQAEVLVRAVADLSLEGRPYDLDGLRTACGDRWWLPAITADALRTVQDELQDAACRWDALAAGEAFAMTWSLAPSGQMTGG